MKVANYYHLLIMTNNNFFYFEDIKENVGKENGV